MSAPVASANKREIGGLAVVCPQPRSRIIVPERIAVFLSATRTNRFLRTSRATVVRVRIDLDIFRFGMCGIMQTRKSLYALLRAGRQRRYLSVVPIVRVRIDLDIFRFGMRGIMQTRKSLFALLRAGRLRDYFALVPTVCFRIDRRFIISGHTVFVPVQRHGRR